MQKHRNPNTIRRFTGFDAIIYIVIILALMIWIIPFVYMIALSFSSAKAIINNQVSFWPVDFTADAYQQVFAYPNFYQAYGNTFFYTSFGTLIALIMTILFAYPLSKTFLRGQRTAMKIVVFSMFFSGGLIPTYMVVQNLGLLDTRWALLLPQAVAVSATARTPDNAAMRRLV